MEHQEEHQTNEQFDQDFLNQEKNDMFEEYDNNDEKSPSEFEKPAKQSDVRWTVEVEVPEIVEEGSLSQKFMVYEVRIQKFKHDSKSPENEYNIVRRYRDFDWLRNKLISSFKGHLIPPIPEKGIVKKFEKEFIRNRRKELGRFLERILNNPLFSNSYHVTAFISDDGKFENAKQQKDKSGKSLLSSLTSIVSSKPQEIDEWFERQKDYLTQTETHFNILLNKLTVLKNNTKDQSFSYQGISQVSSLLSELEASRDRKLSEWYKKLSVVASSLSEIDKKVSINLASTLEDSIRDHIRYIQSATKEAMVERENYLASFQSNSRAREAKQEKLHKNPSDLKALKEVNDAEAREVDSRQQFYAVSKFLKEELIEYDSERYKDIKNSLYELVKQRVESLKETMDLWQELYNSLQE